MEAFSFSVCAEQVSRSNTARAPAPPNAFAATTHSPVGAGATVCGPLRPLWLSCDAHLHDSVVWLYLKPRIKPKATIQWSDCT